MPLTKIYAQEWEKRESETAIKVVNEPRGVGELGKGGTNKKTCVVPRMIKFHPRKAKSPGDFRANTSQKTGKHH